MPYPKIPLVGFWNNPIDYETKFTKTEMGKGGVVSRQKSQFLNPIRRTIPYSGVILGDLSKKRELDAFLRERKGRPFELYLDDENLTGNFICVQYSFTWNVYVEGSGGVWTFSGTFVEDFNPPIE